MTIYRSYPSMLDDQNWDPSARTIINRMLRGKLNISGELVLKPGTDNTILSDNQINATSVLLLMPMSANAALALATLWFSQPANGSVAINHSNNNQTDRIFRYIVMG